MAINKMLMDTFATSAAQVIQEMLDHAQLDATERSAIDDGQLRRVRGITGALQSALNAAAERPGMIPGAPTPFAPLTPPPPPTLPMKLPLAARR
jgi:hypothetical protein